MAELLPPLDQLPVRMRKILFASNFSDTSAMALPYAAAFARRFRAEVCVAHVIPSEEYAHIAPQQLGATLRAMKQAARERIEHLLTESRFSDIVFRVVPDHGGVMTAIASLVNTEAIDLIVAGSRGRHGLQKLIAPPVRCCSSARKLPLSRKRKCGCIASCIPAICTLHRGRLWSLHARARVYDAELYLLHVAENVWREPLSTRMAPEAFCRMRLLESGLPESTLEVESHFLVNFGSAESLVLEAARVHDVQLIVIGVPGAAHPELMSHFPGPLAYDIASHSPCPILAVRNEE